MIFFTAALVGLLASMALVYLLDDDSEKWMVHTLLFFSIVDMIIGVYTYTPVNRVMSLYEEGKVIKEYTIIEGDTTHRWILKND